MILADRVSKKYNSKYALQDLSFYIDKAEIVGIIGKNGSGKTTLLKAIAGIVTPSSGRIWVMDKNKLHMLEENKINIGAMLGANSQIISELTIKDSYELLRAMYNITKADFNEIMNTVGEMLCVNKFINKNVKQLSLGQRTKAEFLYAVLHKPRLLLLDEPTVGIDANAKQAIITAIRWLNHQYSMTILISSHDLGFIENIAQRVIILNNGLIEYDGVLSKIKAMYATICYLSVITERPILDFQDFPIISYEYDSLRTTICFDSSVISKHTMLKFISEQTKIKDVQIIEPTIENILQNLYRNIDCECWR